jgi:hypothetical protein
LLQSNTNGGRAPQTSRAVAQQVDRAAYAIAWPTPDDAAVERKRRELDRLDPDRRISTIIVRRGWIIARGEIDDAESNEGWCRRRSEALARLAERTGGTDGQPIESSHLAQRALDLAPSPSIAPSTSRAPNARPTSLERAISLALQGYPVTPLRPGTSKACMTGWTLKATNDVETLRKTWPRGDYNVGIVTGRLYRDTGKYLFAVDVDNKGDKRGEVTLCGLEMEYDDLPDTRTHSTPSGGYHYLFLSRSPVANSASTRLGKGLDVRGVGGQIAAPGSTKGGVEYEVIKDLPIADAPEWLEAMAGRPIERAKISKLLVELDQELNMERAAEWLRDKAPDRGRRRQRCHLWGGRRRGRLRHFGNPVRRTHAGSLERH